MRFVLLCVVLSFTSVAYATPCDELQDAIAAETVVIEWIEHQIKVAEDAVEEAKNAYDSILQVYDQYKRTRDSMVLDRQREFEGLPPMSNPNYANELATYQAGQANYDSQLAIVNRVILDYATFAVECLGRIDETEAALDETLDLYTTDLEGSELLRDQLQAEFNAHCYTPWD